MKEGTSLNHVPIIHIASQSSKAYLIPFLFYSAACSNFTCASGECISTASRCNNTNDCGDGSDEAGCGKPM